MLPKHAQDPAQVRTGANKIIAEVTAWSMAILMDGVFPTTGFKGESFGVSTYRFKLKDQRIAKGWKIFGG